MTYGLTRPSHLEHAAAPSAVKRIRGPLIHASESILRGRKFLVELAGHKEGDCVRSLLTRSSRERSGDIFTL